jgi:spore maturation protein CgeB
MRFVYFTHSLLSCWNHGNAHFQRGVLRELLDRNHAITILEPENGWSLANLLSEHGEPALAPFRRAYPGLASSTYRDAGDVEAAVADADVVIVHEWTAPVLVAALGRLRRHNRFTLLFHDTHHRAVSDPDAMRRLDLSGYDGVLAFGAALADVYRRRGWGERAFVWHEAADTLVFRPPEGEGGRSGLVWIGNWGDGERTAELETFLLRPAARARLALDIYGVRYPGEALTLLAGYRAAYRGWVANADVPSVFARHLATIHVPRRFYVEHLPGIPTIRVFEALACGIPLVSSPWNDAEHLFTPGEDYLVARDGNEMARHFAALEHDADLRNALAQHGVATIRARHSCAHRAEELLGILRSIVTPVPLELIA